LDFHYAFHNYLAQTREQFIATNNLLPSDNLSVPYNISVNWPGETWVQICLTVVFTKTMTIFLYTGERPGQSSNTDCSSLTFLKSL